MDRERARAGSLSITWLAAAICVLLLAGSAVAGCGKASGPGAPATPEGSSGRDGAAPAATDAAVRPPDAPLGPDGPLPPPPVSSPGYDPDAGPRIRPDSGPPKSCAEIRTCVAFCEQDMACAGRCVDQATAAARTEYQTVTTCSRRVCPTGDINCRCEQECQGGGECLDIVDQCRQFGDDVFCDELCM
jgi:hypothetical protein